MGDVVSKIPVQGKKKKYMNILTADKPTEFKDPDNKTTDEQAKERLNDEAYNNLITSMENKIAFTVNDTITHTIVNIS